MHLPRRSILGGLVFCAAALLSLALAEVSLRAAGPDWLRFRMSLLNVGKTPEEAGSDSRWKFTKTDGHFRSFVARSKFSISHLEYQHEVNFDDWGARLPTSFGKTGQLIPVLGDSFTLGVGVKDQETFVAHWAREHKAAFLNLGVPGIALSGEAKIAELRHQELGSPRKYLFVLFLGNDLPSPTSCVSSLRELSGAARAPSPPPPSNIMSFLEKVNAIAYHSPVLKKLYVIQLTRQAVLRILGKRAPMNPVFQVMDSRNDGSCIRQELGKQVDAVLTWQKAEKVEVAFLLIPDSHQLSDERRELQRVLYGIPAGALDPLLPNRTVAEVFAERSVRFFDATPCLKESFSNDLYYFQDNHFTARGHDSFAKCTAGFIAQFLKK